jgi:hypothetical protein
VFLCVIVLVIYFRIPQVLGIRFLFPTNIGLFDQHNKENVQSHQEKLQNLQFEVVPCEEQGGRQPMEQNDVIPWVSKYKPPNDAVSLGLGVPSMPSANDVVVRAPAQDSICFNRGLQVMDTRRTRRKTTYGTK